MPARLPSRPKIPPMTIIAHRLRLENVRAAATGLCECRRKQADSVTVLRETAMRLKCSHALLPTHAPSLAADA